MATEYLKNGDFRDKLDYWKAPVGFEPDFETTAGGLGQSIKLESGVTVSQSMAELPSHKLHLQFDVIHALRYYDTSFVVVVGGYNQEGTVNLMQVLNFTTPEWAYYSGELDFQEKLKNCFLTISAPADTSFFSLSSQMKQQQFGPVRFANFSLTLAD